MARIAIRFLEPSAQSLTTTAGVSFRPIGIGRRVSNRGRGAQFQGASDSIQGRAPAQLQSRENADFLGPKRDAGHGMRHLSVA